jgi:hypothetical protein
MRFLGSFADMGATGTKTCERRAYTASRILRKSCICSALTTAVGSTCSGFTPCRSPPSGAPSNPSNCGRPSCSDFGKRRHHSKTDPRLDPARLLLRSATPWPSRNPAFPQSAPRRLCRSSIGSFPHKTPVRSATDSFRCQPVPRLVRCIFRGALYSIRTFLMKS